MPTESSSSLPNSTEPSAAKYWAFSGTRMSEAGIHAFGQRELALFPNLGDADLPAILHALDVGVGSAEQQHLRAQRVAARQHRQILLHDGFKQRSHQFVGGHAALLQAVDVGLGENAALAGHRMQLDARRSPSGRAGRRECAAWR